MMKMALWNGKTRSTVDRLINDMWAKSDKIILSELQKELFRLGIIGKKIPKKSEKLINSVTFTQESIELDDRCFTNSYDLSYDTRDSLTLPSIRSRASPFALYELFNNKNVVGAINAGFFYLVDECCQYPQQAAYDLCIRDNQIFGLPLADRAALLEVDFKLFTRKLNATGTISIDGKDFTWKGLKSHKNEGTDFILFNSSFCSVKHKECPKTGTKRILEESSIYTPLDESITDVLVGYDRENLIIKRIKRGGLCNIFDGNFVLRFANNRNCCFKVGMKVKPKFVDGQNLDLVNSGITIGPSVYHFENNDDHEINHDTCHGSKKPTYSERKLAMSMIYEDMANKIHLRIFDGVPAIENFTGITAKEIGHIIPRNETKRAYLLDPGQSSKMVVREGRSGVVAYGNALSSPPFFGQWFVNGLLVKSHPKFLWRHL